MIRPLYLLKDVLKCGTVKAEHVSGCFLVFPNKKPDSASFRGQLGQHIISYFTEKSARNPSAHSAWPSGTPYRRFHDRRLRKCTVNAGCSLRSGKARRIRKRTRLKERPKTAPLRFGSVFAVARLSDILHGNSRHFCRNLPLHRTSSLYILSLYSVFCKAFLTEKCNFCMNNSGFIFVCADTGKNGVFRLFRL